MKQCQGRFMLCVRKRFFTEEVAGPEKSIHRAMLMATSCHSSRSILYLNYLLQYARAHSRETCLSLDNDLTSRG